MLGGCATDLPRSGPACALSELGQVPVVYRAQVPFVQVMINGGAAVAMLDTGSAITVLSPAAATRLGVPGTALVPLRLQGAAGRASAPPVALETITLGRFTIHGLLAVLVPLPIRGLDTLFGYNMLDQFEMELDGPARRLTLYRHRPCSGMVPDGAGWERLPITAAGHHLRLPIAVNGVTLTATLDTGATRTQLTAAAAARAGVAAETLTAAPLIRTEAVGPDVAQVREVKVTRLGVGDAVLDGPVLHVGELPEQTGDALLGGDFLATRRVWFALGRGEVWIPNRVKK